MKVKLSDITILEFQPDEAALRPWTERGVHFVRGRVEPGNLAEILGRHVSAGDIVIDLSWNSDCCEIVQVHDECDVTQTSPDELPAIDIRSL